MDIRNALKELAEGIKVEILRRLSSSIGINTKRGVGYNTLINSKLSRSIRVDVAGDNALTFTIANYYIAVSAGRKAGAKRPPIKAIFDWITDKEIDYTPWAKSQNAAAWAIAKSIEKDGIKGRPFIGTDPKDLINKDVDGININLILTFLDDYFDTWSDKIFKEIMKEIDKWFNG